MRILAKGFALALLCILLSRAACAADFAPPPMAFSAIIIQGNASGPQLRDFGKEFKTNLQNHGWLMDETGQSETVWITVNFFHNREGKTVGAKFKMQVGITKADFWDTTAFYLVREWRYDDEIRIVYVR